MHITFAGFWRRMGAHMIDFIVLSILVWLPLWLIVGQEAMQQGSIVQWVPTLLGIAYYVGFIGSKYQATPGKRLMGVYIVRAGDHMPLDHARAALRYFIYMGPFLLLMAFQPTLAERMKDIPLDEQKQYLEIKKKMSNFEKITEEESAFMNRVSSKQTLVDTPYGQLALLAVLYMIVQACMVAFTKEKTGVHDLLAKTRAVRGRPGVPFTGLS